MKGPKSGAGEAMGREIRSGISFWCVDVFHIKLIPTSNPFPPSLHYKSDFLLFLPCLPLPTCPIS